MKMPQSVPTLEDFGRIRLSRSFFMRDFLYSEIAAIHNLSNVPTNPHLAVETGRHLCKELLEPLNATFGRIAIRSAYRSPQVNEFGNEHGMNCGSNKENAAAHIWDMPDDEGIGAMACIVVPWFLDRYENGADWRQMAYFIHNHLPYSSLQFFPKLCAFNIGWHSHPKRVIQSYIEPRKAELAAGSPPDPSLASWYEDFPALRLE